MDQLFRTQDEAVEAARTWRAEVSGRLLFPKPDPVHAMWGIGGRHETEHLSVRFLYPRFERPLEAVFKKVGPGKLTEIMQGAKSGFFAQADEPSERLIQACEYDLARGMSFVSWTPLSQIIFKLPPEQRPVWTAWMCGPARERLGGYLEERERVAAILKPLIG